MIIYNLFRWLNFLSFFLFYFVQDLLFFFYFLLLQSFPLFFSLLLQTEKIIKSIQLFFLILPRIGDLLDCFFLPIVPFAFSFFDNHHCQEPHTEDEIYFLNFIQYILCQFKMFISDKRTVSFFFLVLIPNNQKLPVLSIYKFDIFFSVIFHLQDQDHFVNRFLKQKAYSFGLRILFFPICLAVVISDCKLLFSRLVYLLVNFVVLLRRSFFLDVLFWLLNYIFFVYLFHQLWSLFLFLCLFQHPD
jgi:hypothetical protein